MGRRLRDHEAPELSFRGEGEGAERRLLYRLACRCGWRSDEMGVRDVDAAWAAHRATVRRATKR